MDVTITERASIPFCSGIAHQIYLPAEEGIKMATESGCTHWYVDGSLHGEMTYDWSEERIANLNEQIARTRVTPLFHGNFKAPLASDVEDIRSAAVEYVKKEIYLAHRIGAPIILHGGCIVEPKRIIKAKQIALDNFVKSVKELARYAADLGVDAYLENLSNYKYYRPFHYIFTHSEEYDYVFTRINSPNVFMFLDAGHANICDGDAAAVVRAYHDRIKGISFSNNNGSQDQHLGIYEGTLDYRAMVRSIIDCNWTGLVAFEIRDKSTERAIGELAEVYEAVHNDSHKQSRPQ